MAKRSRCECGRVKSKWANRCSKCSKERMEAIRAKATKEIADGRCPRCGSPIRQNLALTNWWQCTQFGAEAFRAEPDKPSCDWQVSFTS